MLISSIILSVIIKFESLFHEIIFSSLKYFDVEPSELSKPFYSTKQTIFLIVPKFIKFFSWLLPVIFLELDAILHVELLTPYIFLFLLKVFSKKVLLHLQAYVNSC
jgi:hypothetical protein